MIHRIVKKVVSIPLYRVYVQSIGLKVIKPSFLQYANKFLFLFSKALLIELDSSANNLIQQRNTDNLLVFIISDSRQQKSDQFY